jgi:hypothetical protein
MGNLSSALSHAACAHHHLLCHTDLSCECAVYLSDHPHFTFQCAQPATTTPTYHNEEQKATRERDSGTTTTTMAFWAWSKPKSKKTKKAHTSDHHSVTEEVETHGATIDSPGRKRQRMDLSDKFSPEGPGNNEDPGGDEVYDMFSGMGM